MTFLQLAIFSSIMFFTTLFLGSIPLSLSRSLSPTRTRQLSVFGVGLLVGAALTVIIPEGVDAVYKASSHSDDPPTKHSHSSTHSHPPVGLALLSGFILMFLINQASSPRPPRHEGDDHFGCIPHSSTLPSLATRASPLSLSSRIYSVGPSVESEPTPFCLGHGLLVPRLVSPHPPSSPLDPEPVPRLSAGDRETSFDPESGPSSKFLLPHPDSPASHQSGLLSTTIGLLTHSLADGISLGASSTLDSISSNPQASHDLLALDLVIFLAIMVHKAPVAFGLVTVMISEGVPRHLIRRILLGFSLAAPLGALLTWSLITAFLRHHLTSTPSDSSSLQWWVGITLLFSGGTFLFVAVHAIQHHLPDSGMPHASFAMSEGASQAVAELEGRYSSSSSIPPLSRLMTSLLVVSGMLTPAIMTRIFGHAH